MAGGLERFPRVELAEYPSPLQPLPGLSEELGRPVFAKRDDLIGPAGGGNKTRQLEYLIADALERGETRVVTFGGLHSNHCRLTAAAARRFGLEAHILCFQRRPPRLTGAPRIIERLGGRVHFVPFGGTRGTMRIETAIRLAAGVARLLVRRHAFIPVGGHSWLGALGYARAAAEVDAQARALGIGDATVVTASSTGGTLSGLLAGMHLAGSRLRPLGIDVGRLWRRFRESIAHLATEACARAGAPRQFSPGEVPLVEDAYVGEAYAAPTREAEEAIVRAAEEGLLLDPIYTAKAFAGMLDLIRSGRLDGPVIFLHTGGFRGPGGTRPA